MFQNDVADRTLRVVTSHYLATYVLIDILQEFRRLHAGTAVRLSVRTELQVLGAVAHPGECVLGFCAASEYPEALDYIPWFRMDWWLVVPEGHRFAQLASITLGELDGEGLIVFEPGSTGRQHVFEAFHQVGAVPNIATQATTTPLIVQMVEAGLGVAILPLLPSGIVTQGRRVRTIPIATEIRPIESGIFIQPQWHDDPDALAFIAFARQHVAKLGGAS